MAIGDLLRVTFTHSFTRRSEVLLINEPGAQGKENNTDIHCWLKTTTAKDKEP